MTEYSCSEWKKLLDSAMWTEDWIIPISQFAYVRSLIIRGYGFVTKEPLAGWRQFNMVAQAVIYPVEAVMNKELSHQNALKEAKMEVAVLSLSDLIERSIGSGFLFENKKSEDWKILLEWGATDDETEAKELVLRNKKVNDLHRQASVSEDESNFLLPIDKFRLISA